MARAKNKPRKPKKPNPTPKVKQIEAALTKPVDPLMELKDVLTVDMVKKYICPTANDTEIGLFLTIAKSYKLNPFKREIYLVIYDGKNGREVSVQVGYEVYLKRASRIPAYAGFKAWTEPKDAKIPVKACVKVFRKDWKEPLEHEVDFDEFVKMRWDKEARRLVPTKFWKKMPKSMIKKVVISQAFRQAFPDEMGGLPYIQEEIHPKENIKDAEATVTPAETHVKMPERTDKSVKPKPEAKKPDPPKEPAKPVQPAVKYVSPGQIETLKGLCVAKNLDPDEIAHSYFGANSVKTLPANKAGMFMNEVSKIK
ncbi:hypothetical protein LCGC14_1457990 [marine sediment metagenome]|uniref:Phage recombination protein Bet n=1 Tax=marine sediment metagenome TaxID=412755 RepID=A0A0F9LWI4_9ZZZZ